MRHELHFRPAARLQVVLSEELVADPNVAVLEFVKNAYDAEAARCLVRFELGVRPADGRLIVADDGSGMDLEGLKRNFMRPGFSEKAEAEVEDGSGRRVPVGEKGLGRLAAGRLGEQIDLYTRRRPSDPWLHLGFRWSDFNDMQMPLDEVPVWVDDEHEPPETIGETGTIVVISRLRMRWDAGVPGRKVVGRAATRLGRLRQDFELLLLPLQAADTGFALDLEHNSAHADDVGSTGPVQPPDLRLLDYQLDFAFEQDDDGWTVLRTIRRSESLAERLGVEVETDEEVDAVNLVAEGADLSAVGGFDASIYYAPESAQALSQIRAPVGVRLYRDSVHVDPYGEPGDDWLGVAAHKASRQGHAAVNPKALYGAVRISRRGNPDLRPQVNREGLLDTEALQSFLQICRAQLRWFESVVLTEWKEPKVSRGRTERQSDEREAEALTVQRYAVGITRATVHALRQPVAAAGGELYRLQRTLDESDLPDDLRARLQDLHDRTAGHLKRMDAAADRMMTFLNFDPTPREVDVNAVIRQVLAAAETTARSKQVRLTMAPESENLRLMLPGGLVERSLEELVENAVRAQRPAERVGHGEVTVVARRNEDTVTISVQDDAGGVADGIAKSLFRETISTGGHIGVGLMFMRQLLALARGDLRLGDTGSQGSRFDIILPTQ